MKKFCIWLLLFMSTSPVFASAELHMVFHAAISNGGKSYVGATLKNTGSNDVAHGYIVATFIDKNCTPVKSVIETFSKIRAGEKVSIKIPVPAMLEIKNYRLSGFAAFDRQGFPVLAVDDGAKIIRDREPKEREYCNTVSQNGSPSVEVR